MAAFVAAQVKLGSGAGSFAGSALAAGSCRPGAAAAPGPQRLQVTASKRLMGRVVTDTNDKSVTVEVNRIAQVPKYKKRIRTTKNYIVHDPENAAHKGDTVFLAKCAPVSKRKHFYVTEIRKARARDADLEGSSY